MPNCPYCNNSSLQYDDQYDEYDNGRTIFKYWRGTCLTCGRHYSWCEKYDFIDFYDFKEEKELE